jgi:hypothetical protein
MKEQPDVRTRGTAQFNQSLKLTGEDASSLALTSSARQKRKRSVAETTMKNGMYDG